MRSIMTKDGPNAVELDWLWSCMHPVFEIGIRMLVEKARKEAEDADIRE